MANENLISAAKFGKFGPKVDPRGWHVVGGNGRLGEIVSLEYREHGGSGVFVNVRHFDGSTWPQAVAPSFLTVLERRAEAAQ